MSSSGLRGEIGDAGSCQHLLERAPDGFDRLGVGGRAAREVRQPLGGARPRRVAAASSLATALVIMPAPAVKFVAGSIRMKLPVDAVVACSGRT